MNIHVKVAQKLKGLKLEMQSLKSSTMTTSHMWLFTLGQFKLLLTECHLVWVGLSYFPYNTE